jgi:hypothetical protein
VRVLPGRRARAQGRRYAGNSSSAQAGPISSRRYERPARRT